MNQFSQQPSSFQGQGFGNQQQQFQPSGFVQSHYQGQLSQPTFNRQQSGSIVGQPQGGFAAQNNQYGGMQQSAPISQSYTQSAVPNNSYISHAPVQSHASSPATAFGEVGPVIARLGYQAGPDAQQQQFGQQTLYQPSSMGYQQQSQQPRMTSNAGYQSFGGGQMNATQSYGMTQAHSSTPLNPVYQATHAYEQAGPVIQHFGGWQNTNQGGYTGGNR